MSREQNIPLVLWVSTAILAHIATVGGADQVSRVIEDHAGLHEFADALRGRLRPPTTIEVAFEGPIPAPPEPEQPPVAPPPAPTPAKPEPQAKADTPELEQPKPPEPEPPKPVAPPPTAAASAAAPPPPEPKADRRIAVRQHVEPDQQDNPNAHFVGDEANHVAEESIARITSHDQDDPNPTPGGQHHGPDEDPGNSDRTRVGESEDRPGEEHRAPGESGKSPEPLPAAAAANAPTADGPHAPAPAPAGARTPAPQPGASPEPVATGEGYRLDPMRPNVPPANNASPGSQPAPTPATPLQTLGLGGRALANGINLNLTQQGVVAAVGQDQLSRERVADGERRKSLHRGSWRASGFERWRAAIENYVSSVKYGNNTSLNTARVPFATYLNGMHNRIHPIFADDFLMSLDGVPPGHPMNDPKMYARLEIVLDRDEGRVLKMGIVKTSGVTAFDIAALDSVQRASPFGKAPTAIVSRDGNVYLHWEFHRDPLFACSTAGASPYMLNTPPPDNKQPAPKSPTPPLFPPGDPRERGYPPDSRHGQWLGPTTDRRPQSPRG